MARERKNKYILPEGVDKLPETLNNTVIIRHREMKLPLYVIYDHLSDYPDLYVIRKMVIGKGETFFDLSYMFTSSNLETCRNEMRRMNLTVLPRDKEDDPVIVESWI